jgi:hypothetical protein
MPEIEKIVQEINGTMAIEGMPLAVNTQNTATCAECIKIGCKFIAGIVRCRNFQTSTQSTIY